MTSLTIQLDDRTNSRLLALSRRAHEQPEAVVADAVRRRLFVDWFEGMNDTLSERAAKRGFLNKDDFCLQ